MNQDRIEVLLALSVRVSAYAKRLSKAPHDEVLVEPLRSLYKVQATVTWQLHGLLSYTSPPRLAPRLAAPEVILDRAFRDLRSFQHGLSKPLGVLSPSASWKKPNESCRCWGRTWTFLMTHPSGRRPSSSRRCADRSGPCEWAVAAGWLGSCGAAAFESDGFESVDQPIRPDVPQYGRRDLFDGLVRGRQPGDALALHRGGR